MTTILMARHGETDWNRDQRFQGHADPPLNDVGREQARELAERLAGERLDAVYTSPLQRASETAAIVAARLGLTPEPLDGAARGRRGLLVRPDSRRRSNNGSPTATGAGSTSGTAGTTASPMTSSASGCSRRSPSWPRGIRAAVILVVTHGGPMRAAEAASKAVSYADARRVASADRQLRRLPVRVSGRRRCEG